MGTRPSIVFAIVSTGVVLATLDQFIVNLAFPSIEASLGGSIGTLSWVLNGYAIVFAALISRATGVDPYFVGKPNPLMMRSALNAIDAHSETAAMVGDRMDTDVVAGLEAGMHTVLVLTGSTRRDEAERFPYRPSRIVDSIADLVDELG